MLPDLIKDKINSLPHESRIELENYIDFLLYKYNLLNSNEEQINRGNEQKPSFEWAGGLKDLKKKYTSVELQHLISDWR